MSYFFTFFVQPFLPIAMLLGVVWANKKPLPIKMLLCLSSLGLVMGTIFSLYCIMGQTSLLIFALTLIIAYLFFYIGQFYSPLAFEKFWSFFLPFIGGTLWGQDPNIHLITHTDVINSAFLLNVSAIILGWLFCVWVLGYVILIFQQMSTLRQVKPISRILVTAIIFFLLLPVIGKVLLSLMKLQILALTGLRLSFVAKVGAFNDYLNYINGTYLILLTLFFTLYVYLPRSRERYLANNLIAQRQAQARLQQARRSIIAGGMLIFILFATTLYWYQVASLPPALSESKIVRLSKDNAIHIPIETVQDGNLHRFIWVASDGHAIRFFLINRSLKKRNLAAVFDACLLCGDSGYVVDGDKLMCIACGVRLFIPSVGKAGGCNPIPMEGWREEKGDVLIPKQTLLAGMNYFSTVLEIEVEDPVSHQKLTNKQANYRYDYQGNTYFFVSEHNQNLFREKPETYLKGWQKAN